MKTVFQFLLSVVRVAAILLIGSFLLTAILSFLPGSPDRLPFFSYEKEGWMRGTLTVGAKAAPLFSLPVDLRGAASLLERLRFTPESDPIGDALAAFASDVTDAALAAFGSVYEPDGAVGA